MPFRGRDLHDREPDCVVAVYHGGGRGRYTDLRPAGPAEVRLRSARDVLLLFRLFVVDRGERGDRGISVPRRRGERVRREHRGQSGDIERARGDRSVPVCGKQGRAAVRARFRGAGDADRVAGVGDKLPAVRERVSGAGEEVHRHVHGDIDNILPVRGGAGVFYKQGGIIKI